MAPQEFDRWRIVPRLIVTAYCYMFYEISNWFMTLQDPTAAQAAFVSTMVGASAAFFNFYVNSGNKQE